MTSQTGQQVSTIHITYIAQYFKMQRQPDNEIYFLKNHTQDVLEELVPDPFIKNRN